MSWWRATLSAGVLVVGLQTVAAASPAAGLRPHNARAPGALASPVAAQPVPKATSAARRRTPPPAPPALPPGAHASIVGRSPFGLSIEYPLMEQALGSGPCPGPALVATLRELGSPSLRIGGDSQDLAGPSGAYHYPVPASFWPTLGCLARETGSQITVGLNFATAPLADELTTIAAAEQAIPAQQLSFSLGNEPDLYGISHILPDEPAFTMPIFRAAPWTAEQYVSEWDSRRALLGPVAIEGPDFAGSQWGSTVASRLAADPPTTFDVHDYPTSACGAGAERPTPARLLSEHASVGLLDKYAWMLALARGANRPIVVSESNSASCGGTPGISNTPVAGVWAARFVVASLLAGYAQVRFHSAGTSYDPLLFDANGDGHAGAARPRAAVRAPLDPARQPHRTGAARTGRARREPGSAGVPPPPRA